MAPLLCLFGILIVTLLLFISGSVIRLGAASKDAQGYPVESWTPSPAQQQHRYANIQRAYWKQLAK